MQKITATVETPDGVYGPYRVGSAASLVQWSRTSKSLGLDRNDEAIAQLFLVWHAARVIAEDISMSWEEFSSSPDVFMDISEDEQAQDDPAGPTQQETPSDPSSL